MLVGLEWKQNGGSLMGILVKRLSYNFVYQYQKLGTIVTLVPKH